MSARRPRCPFGLCDGSGFVVDEETRIARAVPLPRRSASSAAARAALSAVIPRRYSGVVVRPRRR